MEKRSIARLISRHLRQPVRFLTAAGLGLSLALVLIGALASFATPARAGTLCVKPGGGDGCQATIMAALSLAQENDTIRVAAGVYNENVTISRTVTVQGGWDTDFTGRDTTTFLSVIFPADNSQSVVTIQGNFADPAAVAPTLDGFVIGGGRADLGGNHGGGLRIVDSNAVVISNTIQNNVAFLLGGGVWVQRGAPRLQGNQIVDNRSLGLGQDAYGGGLELENSGATLLDNVFSGNVVSGTEAYGGGLAVIGSGGGQVALTSNHFFSNTALSAPAGVPAAGYGGAIALRQGQLLLQDSTLISNTAATAGGGIFVGGNGAACCGVTATGNEILANTAIRGGGLTIEGDGEDCCEFSGEGNVYRQNVALRGGGIYIGGNAEDCCQFRGTNTEIGQNVATDGGGLYADAQRVRLRGGLLISNTATAGGGGALVGSGGFISLTNSLARANRAGENGGGLLIGAGSFISLTHSAALANRAEQDGGGIYNAGVISVSNTTVSGNSAGGMGGGIANLDTVALANATVADNTGPSGAGLFNGSVAGAVNSLIALNSGDNCLGALNSLGHNLEDGFTCALGQASDLPDTAPALGALLDNGGATPTHALAPGSPAVDAGSNAACAPRDQRGVPRPLDGDGDGLAVCDIGAYEYRPAAERFIYLPLAFGN